MRIAVSQTVCASIPSSAANPVAPRHLLALSMLTEHRPVVAKTAIEQAPVIELEGLSKRYGSVSVLNALSMRVPAGGYFALGGASGAGKTTLLGILGLLETPTAGEYRFHGESTSTLSDRQLSELRNRAFGFVFQQFSLVPSLSAWQNVARPLTFAGVPRREHRRRALELLDRLGLAARAEHKPSQLSGGEQQRVAIARALINDPEVILADEPTGNLPQELWGQVLDMLETGWRNGKTVIVVTHEPAVAARAQRIVRLRDDRLERERGEAVSPPVR